MAETVETTAGERRYHDPVKAAAVIEQLVAGQTVKGAAEATGVSVHTINNWKRDERFVKQLQARQEEVISELRGMLPSLAVRAVDAYVKALNGELDITSRYKAAADILRTIKFIGENVETPNDPNETVELISIGLNDKDEAVPLPSENINAPLRDTESTESHPL